jgi:hypothetical protein
VACCCHEEICARDVPLVPDFLMDLRKPDPPGAPELRAIEACLQGEYGPWPHLWEDHEDILRATAEAGLRREGSIDATRQTLPTCRITAPKRWLGLSARFGAGDVLRWLHETGRLTDLCARFLKQEPARAVPVHWPLW